ncbi:MAG: hypothetical protein Q4G68_00545 [Planctomycetia bacterium]|nr:hypothetical protein [Planctomycetia bacterium]
MRRKKTLLFGLALFVLFCGSGLGQEFPYPVAKIWDASPHNAFTDLLYFQDAFYCTFRESTGHVPGPATGVGDGTVRVLRSEDGENWESVTLLAVPTYDLRDAKLSVTPDGRLMVLMGGSVCINGSWRSRLPHVAFSENGREFSQPVPLRVDPEIKSDVDWIWRVTWRENVGYGVLYQDLSQSQTEWQAFLVKTTNGIDYEKVSKLNVTGLPNEATARFDAKGNMTIFIRREGDDTIAKLGCSASPYTDWKWHDVGVRIGGPNLIYLSDDSVILGGRVDGLTKIGTLTDDFKYRNLWVLPSGGDCSYPGFCVHNDKLWISWYSSHEGHASIYITSIPLADVKKAIATP